MFFRYAWHHHVRDLSASGAGKLKKNSKVNLGGSYKFKIAAKYKKPKTRGDKNYNKRNKKK